MDFVRFMLFVLVALLCFSVCQNAETSISSADSEADDAVANSNSSESSADPVQQAKLFESGLKTLLKNGVKSILPTLMKYNSDSGMSKKCARSFLKYIAGLTSVKLWAIQMLDATSKPPAGVFEGTFSDFGAFDQCLNISVPFRNGTEEFRGAYCAIEAKPYMPPIPRNFSIAHRRHAGPMDTVGKEILIAGGVFYFLKFRFGVCVPSTCTANDLRAIAGPVSKRMKIEVKIPRCYVREPTKLDAIHIVVMRPGIRGVHEIPRSIERDSFILVLLAMLAAVGTAFEILSQSRKLFGGKYRSLVDVLLCFSLLSNYKRLVAISRSPGQMKALHGIRALSMCWVILGHTYVWSNFQLLRHPSRAQDWMNALDMAVILNGWLSVEPFFLLSGILTCYGTLQVMEKTKGRIPVTLFILRRYIRLTPCLLMVMGLMFFLPVISSGPFWYEKIDPEINSCTKNWWTGLLYISNWTSMMSICIHPTWYLSADFQLHIFSIILLYIIYRSFGLGLLALALFTLASNVAIAVITYLWDLPPIILISSANYKKITETVDLIHIRTFTHLGPYCLGILVGYLILKYKDVRMTRTTCAIGWCASFTVSVASLYGVHRWNTGQTDDRLLTCVYAALHRTTFTAGVAWVAFACVTGHAGIVNKFLSLPILAPLSRLTYVAYLVQSLVIWIRKASARERMFYSHYNMLYEYIGHLVVVFVLAFPLHLLVEAPVSNLDRLIFGRVPKTSDSGAEGSDQPDENSCKSSRLFSDAATANRTVELRSVKALRQEEHENCGNGSAINSGFKFQ